MQGEIKILDCTLRDGGHIVDGKFGEDKIKYIIKKLVDAQIDIIEIGFLWESVCDKDMARYYNLEDVRRILPKDRGVSHFSLMADFIDVEHLEPCDGTVEFIRLSFGTIFHDLFGYLKDRFCVLFVRFLFALLLCFRDPC